MGSGFERDNSSGKGAGRFERKQRRPDFSVRRPGGGTPDSSARRPGGGTPDSSARRPASAAQRSAAAPASCRPVAAGGWGLSSRLFLPTTVAEMSALGWSELDILLVSGDAYVDHPSFGTALLGRWLQAKGYRVGIVAQPEWGSPVDVARLGRPRLFAGVTAGAVDSMLAHYTAFRKKRSDDAYTPGGRAGARPNRATIVYTN